MNQILSLPASLALLFIVFSSASCSQDAGPGPVVPTSTVERQMIGLLQKFDLWDDDGSGFLERGELVAGLVGTPYTSQQMLDFYDTNRDGRISLREAQSGYQRSSEAAAAARSHQNS